MTPERLEEILPAVRFAEIIAADFKTPIHVDRFGGNYCMDKDVRVYGHRAIIHRRELVRVLVEVLEAKVFGEKITKENIAQLMLEAHAVFYRQEYVVSGKVNLYDRARREVAASVLSLPEDLRLPKSAVQEMLILAWVRGFSARKEPEEKPNGE